MKIGDIVFSKHDGVYVLAKDFDTKEVFAFSLDDYIGTPCYRGFKSIEEVLDAIEEEESIDRIVPRERAIAGIKNLI